MIIGGFISCSLVDFPNEVAAIVFTQGCNFDCFYCYNKELLPITDGKYTEQAIVKKILDNKIVTGVVITGGEPCLQPDIISFCTLLKEHGLKVKVDTNGYFPKVLNCLIQNELVDFIAMDIKAPLEKYNKVIQQCIDISKIQQSINLIQQSTIPSEFRLTVATPILIEEDIQLVKELAGNIPLKIQKKR